MVSRSIWRSSRFGALTASRDKLLFFYLMTNEHQNGAGCYRLPDGYAIADLGWTLDDYLAAREAVQAAGLIDRDPDTDEIFVERWLRNNPPHNKSHATGIKNLIFAVESDRLRQKLEADFAEASPPEQIPGGSRLANSAYFQGRGS